MKGRMEDRNEHPKELNCLLKKYLPVRLKPTNTWNFIDNKQILFRVQAEDFPLIFNGHYNSCVYKILLSPFSPVSYLNRPN